MTPNNEPELVAFDNSGIDTSFSEREIQDTDTCNYLMQGSKLEDFIRLSSSHAATCGKQLVLVDRDNTRGCYLKQIWKCVCCGEELVLENCDIIRSKSVAQGAAHSRKQPDFNIRILKGAALTGINMKKLVEFLKGELGVNVPAYRNLRTQMTKVRQSIKDTFKWRLVENRKEHVAAVREFESYHGDLQWEKDGVVHSTSVGDVSHDGAGCTRIYNYRHRGRQSAFVVNSKTTGKPLALVVSQVSLVDVSTY